MTAPALANKLIEQKQWLGLPVTWLARLALCALFLCVAMVSPQVGAEESSPGVVRDVIELQEKGTDVFYLGARLGREHPVELMLDTGSGYLAINENVLQVLEDQGMAQYQRHIHARLAGGAIRKVPIYSIARISLGQDCTLYNTEAAVLPGKSRNILGLNVLKRMRGFSVSFNPPRLILEGCRQPERLAKNDLPEFK